MSGPRPPSPPPSLALAALADHPRLAARTIPGHIDQSPVLEVWVGSGLSAVRHTLVAGARAEFGFDQRTARASVRVTADPEGLYGTQPEPAAWDLVELRVGPNEVDKYTRFFGYFVNKTRSAGGPAEAQWELRGRLYRAVWYKNLEAGGTDLSNAGAGRTDEAIVKLILDRAGVPYTAANIGGTGALWGTIAYDPDQKLNPFIWKEGETALAAIERIDEVSTNVISGVRGAFRTYEGIDGQIYRTHVTAVPATSTTFADFVQGLDILEGASSVLDDREGVCNQATVDGWFAEGDSQEDATYTATGPDTLLPPGQANVSERTQSLFLERATGTVGAGRSCQQQAEYRLDVVNTSVTRATLPTYRGDRLEPGHTIYVLAPETLELDDYFWLEHLSWEFQGGRWTQTLDVARRAAAPALRAVADQGPRWAQQGTRGPEGGR